MFNLSEQIDPNNAAHLAMLANLQANIIKHHGRQHALHIFLQFNESQAAAIKQWISRFSETLTSAATQLRDTDHHKMDSSFDGGMVRCFFLSASGYKKLGLEDSMPADEAFRSGLEKRTELFSQPYDLWEDKFKHTDAMILLADMQADNLQVELDAELFTGISYQKGEILRNEQGLGIEHFGYVDGVSQPSFIKKAVTPGKTWDDNAVLDVLLTPDYGSYLVFLKLEQNVEAFKKEEEKLGALLQYYSQQPIDEEIAGAYIVGRFEAGNPVVKHDTEKKIESDHQFDNDFDYRYDKNGSRCPFHAHIRTTNPRNGLMTGPFPRITRRGIPYDEAGRNNDLDWHPPKDVGLLFMSYQASIKDQFEVMQKAANTSAFGIDGVIGQGNNPNRQRWPANWGEAERIILTQDFAHFITMKGGEYYFAPSIPFLKGLANP